MEDVVIVGAGWAGLAAASRLRARGVDPLILDKGPRAGGAATTWRQDDWLVEAGPHGFFPGEPPLNGLILEHPETMGMLIEADPSARDRYILRRGRRVPLPRSPSGLLTSKAMGPAAKLRLVAEPFVPARDNDDESLAAFTRRRFGKGVDPLVDAMATGVFGGDPARLSAGLAFPRMVEAEHVHGSVLKGLARSGRSKGPLHAPLYGMGALLNELAAPMRIRCSREVVDVRGIGPFDVVLDEQVISARRLILALPPEQTASLFGLQLEPLPRASVAVVGMGWTDGSVTGRAFAGYGTLHPFSEGRSTLGVLYESSLFPGRAPEGGVLVRALVGGRRRPGQVGLDDDALAAKAVRDVMETHGLDVPPDWMKVLRPPPIPQPELGHAARLSPLRDLLASKPDCASAGWGWQGVGIAESVRSGQDAAETILAKRLVV